MKIPTALTVETGVLPVVSGTRKTISMPRHHVMDVGQEKLRFKGMDVNTSLEVGCFNHAMLATVWLHTT